LTERLQVRVSDSFYEDLDRQLSSDRGPNGEPSRIDFETVELIAIVDEFASGFEEIPQLIKGRNDYRLLIKTGMLLAGMSVVGQLMSDGVVELLSIDLDLNMRWDESD